MWMKPCSDKIMRTCQWRTKAMTMVSHCSLCWASCSSLSTRAWRFTAQMETMQPSPSWLSPTWTSSRSSTACVCTRGQRQSRLDVSTSRWPCGCSPQCLPLPSHTRWRPLCRSRCRCSCGPWPARQCWVAFTPSSCTGRKLRNNKVDGFIQTKKLYRFLRVRVKKKKRKK